MNSKNWLDQPEHLYVPHGREIYKYKSYCLFNDSTKGFGYLLLGKIKCNQHDL